MNATQTQPCPLYGCGGRVDQSRASVLSTAAGSATGDAATTWTTEFGQPQTSTDWLCSALRAAVAGGTVLAARSTGRLPRTWNDVVRRTVSFAQSEEHRLGNELGTAPEHLPGELDRQQVLHVCGGAVTAAGLLRCGHRVAAVEPYRETQ